MALCVKRMTSHCTTDRGTAPLVKRLRGAALALLFAIAGTADGLAQDQAPAASNSTTAPLTGKERLGRKWMDEQRIDNCKVPADKQGGRPRSSECPHVPTG
jgi:hypothetical protein